jgi:hypothetical protein
MNTITKMALMVFIYNLDRKKEKTWFQYILMDSAYLTLQYKNYPYNGYLSKRFLIFTLDKVIN